MMRVGDVVKTSGSAVLLILGIALLSLIVLGTGFLLGIAFAEPPINAHSVVDTHKDLELQVKVAEERGFDRGFSAGIEHEAWFCSNTDPALDARMGATSSAGEVQR